MASIPDIKHAATAIAAKGDILAVDDTPSSLRLLNDLLSAEGYRVRSAINGELALQAAIAHPPELILLDANMPGLDGFEICHRLKQDPLLRDVPVIFVSAMSDTRDKLRGFDIGAVDYVTKPFQREELLARVRTHLELHRLRHRLEEMVEQRTYSLSESEKQLKRNLLESVSAVAAMVELRDPYTAGHQRRVAQLAESIAVKLDLSEEMIEGLVLASVVHDVGKISIPTEILTKPGHLNDAEFSLIKHHPSAGYEILKEIDFPWPIADIVLQHHERLNGSGYPKGLSGEEILYEAQILAVADVIEAMASHRPYRPGLGIEVALEAIKNRSGTHFLPEVASAAIRVFREDGYRLEIRSRLSILQH
jgi:response regulator RpfG family c-di-GMP phosphodiesterase